MSTPPPTSLALLLGALALTPIAPRAQETQAPTAPGRAAVDVDDLRTWLHHLASDELGGRGTGEDGFRLAAEYVRDHFAKLGLEPRGDQGTFFQRLPWAEVSVDAGATSLAFRRDGKEIVVPGARLGGSVSLGTENTGPVVLITDLEAVGDADLAGRIALVALEDDPAGRRRGGARFAAMRALQGKDLAALVFVQRDPVDGPPAGTSGARGRNRALRGASLMPSAVTFGGEDLRAVLALAGQAEALDRPGVHDLGLEATVTITVREEEAPAWNVVAVLPGGDPARRDEYVVIGSHLDHLGRRQGQLFPGADDDASGTTGVMAVASMLAARPERPARSVLFVCFCGEERGLLGSRYFVDNPPIPLESIVAELQMDMIGRDEEEARDGRRLVNRGETAEENRNTLHLVGTRQLAPALHELCVAKNESAGFELEWDQEDMFGRSDHANFARHGVPVAFFFTGLHRDYHQPTDTPDKIRYDKLLRVAGYVRDIAWELATAADRPRVDPELWQKMPRKERREPAAPLLGEDGR